MKAICKQCKEELIRPSRNEIIGHLDGCIGNLNWFDDLYDEKFRDEEIKNNDDKSN